MKKSIKAVICTALAFGFVLSTTACDLEGVIGGVIDDPIGTIGGIFNPDKDEETPETPGDETPETPDGGGETPETPGGNDQTGGESVQLTLMLGIDANADGIEDTMSFNVNVGGQYTLPTPEKDGYDLKGWYKETSKGEFDSLVEKTGVWNETGVTRLQAKWEEKTYTLKFVSDDEVACPADVTAKYLQELDISNADNITPERVGYKFCGWMLGETGLYFTEAETWNYIDEYDAVSDDIITLKAAWKVIEYTIDYQYDKGTVVEEQTKTFTVETLSSLELLEVKCSGYVFNGWSLDGGKTVISEITKEMIAGLEYSDVGDKCVATIRLTAVWEDDEKNWTANY